MQLINLVVFVHMWAWISSFLLFYLICYYICDELTPYLTLEIRHFCRKNHRIPHCFLKNIKYGIFVAKISTNALPGQILEEITHIFDQFNPQKISWKYRDILHHIEISCKYRVYRIKQYRSWVGSTRLGQNPKFSQKSKLKSPLSHTALPFQKYSIACCMSDTWEH